LSAATFEQVGLASPSCTRKLVYGQNSITANFTVGFDVRDRARAFEFAQMVGSSRSVRVHRLNY
jgi:hypothetical protein